jgi:ferric-dicitrate binding protein FerR (iron transport regulator)
MTTSDPLSGVTQLLRDAVARPGDVDVMPPGRDAAIAQIADALRARARMHRRRRLWTTLSLAAGAALVIGGGAFAVHRSQQASGAGASADARNLGRLVDPSGAATALRDGRAETVSGGARLVEGTELRTGAADASLDFDSGTHVTLGGGSRMRLVEQSARKRFALESGTFFAKVAKLKADERFVVSTADAEVEVRGTAFRVAVVPGDPACEGGTPTRLDVSEGVVVITHAGAQVRVAAGEHWPACAASAASPSVLAANTTAATVEPVAAPAATPVSKLADAPPTAITTAATVAAAGKPTAPHGDTLPGSSSASRLAEQNDLFDDAMRRKRGGDASGALAKLDRLLAEYPGGPLSESASAERMRVLASSDRSRALGAAREYLRRYPRGFARAEAEAIAAGSP